MLHRARHMPQHPHLVATKISDQCLSYALYLPIYLPLYHDMRCLEEPRNAIAVHTVTGLHLFDISPALGGSVQGQE
eukprot:1159555-Pelagomonas_calceolata.AAC.12